MLRTRRAAVGTIGRPRACCSSGMLQKRAAKRPARLLVMAESVKVLVEMGGHGVEMQRALHCLASRPAAAQHQHQHQHQPSRYVH